MENSSRKAAKDMNQEIRFVEDIAQSSETVKDMGKENFFICLTPLHFYFSYSIACRLYEKNGIRSIILIKGNFDYKNQIPFPFVEVININNKAFFDKVICKIKYKLFFKATVLYRKIKKNMAALYVFNFNDPLTKNMIRYANTAAKITYVEEGIGSWNHTWNGGDVPEKVGCALMGEPEMFMKTHPGFSGELIRLDYKEFFNEERARTFCNMTIDNAEIGKIDYLYLGICDNELVETRYEMEALKKILEYIPKEKKIYIKKHPRDTSRKYYDLTEIYNNVKIMDKELNKVPVECLIYANNISVIISIMSSAGVYIPHLKKDVKSVLLYKIKPITESGLYSTGAFKEEEIASFNCLMETIDSIYCPEDYGMLREILH